MAPPTGKVRLLPGWDKRPGGRPEHVDRDAHRRRRAYAATAELVVERGYHETTARDVARRAEVGVTTFYRLFDSKRDAYLGLFDATLEAGRTRVRAALATAGPWPAQVAAAVDAALAFAAAEPAQVLACIDGAHAAGGEAVDRYNRAQDEWATLLRRGRQPSAEAPLPSVLEEALVGGATWILRQRLRADEAATLAALRPQALDFLLGPYRL